MNLFFRRYGRGKPIIILHGLTGMSDNWIQPAKILANSYEVYLPDLRNHGLSPHDPVHTYESISEDIKEFITEHSLNDVILVGHSMGGKAAMLFADTYADLIRKLIVIDMSPLKYEKNDLTEMKANHFEILTFMNEFDIDNILSRQELAEVAFQRFKDEFIVQMILKNVKHTEKKYSWKLNVSSILNNMENIGKELDLSEKISEIDSLFVFGKNSPYFSEEAYFSVKEFFLNAEIKVIQDAGHNIHLDKKVELIQIIQEFIEE